MRGQMASSSSTMTVVDVYDAAASIGKEFEKMIDSYGAEAVTELMPKVITVLEQLEILANSAQKENAEITELKIAVERLTAEKVAKTEERHRYEQELEQIEESWRKESRELVETVARLQDDNKKLRGTLNQHQEHTDNVQNDLGQGDRDVESIIGRLKEQTTKQRHIIRQKERTLSQRNVDLEAMESQLEQETKSKSQAMHDLQIAQVQISSLLEEQHNKHEMQNQLERMARVNAEYRRKTTLTQQRAQNLIQDKADLQAQLHDKEQQITSIKAQMNQDSIESPASPVSLSSPQMAEKDVDRMQERLLMDEGKMVIDLKDPDGLRFSMNELKEVLTERNELKTKLIEVEEELQHFKPVEMTRQEEEEEDPPVQGPLPQEPYDKLYPGSKKESGIRKFFNFLLSPGKNKQPSNIPMRQVARE